MTDIASQLHQSAFAFVEAKAMRAELSAAGDLSDWAAFADSWNRLSQDTYMADGGRYRQRRHAVFACTRDGNITRKADQPHYQSRDRNPLNGGIQRWFEPVLPEIANGATMQTVLRYCHGLFGALQPETDDWHVETHQFRIVAKPGEEGRPTPEGMHRDGVDYVLVMLVRREAVLSGETTVADLDQRPLGSFTLAQPLDAALVNDRKVYHGVTPIVPAQPEGDAYRDVLVVTCVDRRRAVQGGMG
ncbi:MAG: 2OG-Fe dioxygenase family protein [Hyphomicrobiaceae bacterium]|nr:2OG-Fe dioxygenase family protein [Hyphomicrobiaceae bacterium]